MAETPNPSQVRPNTTDDSTTTVGAVVRLVDLAGVGILPALDGRNLLNVSGNGGINNFTATTDPTSGDDSADGYSVGSRWINTAVSPRREFVCVTNTAAAAVWIQVTNSIANVDSPGQYFLGSILNYGAVAGLTVNEIQYTRVFLQAGLVLTKGQVFVDSGGSAARRIMLGLYDQATPSAVNGVPNNRVAVTALTSTAGADGTYLNVNFSASYTVPTSGYYWIALISESASLKFVITPTTARADFWPTRRESAGSTALPSTAGTLTNPLSAVAFAAVLE